MLDLIVWTIKLIVWALGYARERNAAPRVLYHTGPGGLAHRSNEALEAEWRERTGRK